MRKNQGFTLIELLIVVAIIAIIAAVAIPNLLQARMRANESNTVVLLRKYVDAQQAFRNAKAGALPANSAKGGTDGYADDFTALYHGHPLAAGPDGRPVADEEKTLTLIDKDFAGAKAPDGTPVHGYLFIEPEGAGAGDAEVTVDPKSGYAAAGSGNFWASRFALLAVPAVAGRTGSRAFFIADDGVLLMKELPADTRAADSMTMDTPLKNAAGWAVR